MVMPKEQKPLILTAVLSLTEETGSFDELVSGQCARTSRQVLHSFEIVGVAADRCSSVVRVARLAAWKDLLK